MSVNFSVLSGTTRIALSVEAGTDVSNPTAYKRDPMTDEICARSLRQTATHPHHFYHLFPIKQFVSVVEMLSTNISRPEKRNIRYALSNVAQSYHVYWRLSYVVAMETRYFSIKKNRWQHNSRNCAI
jgi:hypothetical protein